MSWPLRRPRAPASCADVDIGLAARAIIEADGNMRAAARKLKVPTPDLRVLVRASPVLDAAVSEGLDRLIDQAWAVIFEGLEDKDLAVRLKSARALLRASPAAWRRGFGRGVGVVVVERPPPPLAATVWIEGRKADDA